MTDFKPIRTPNAVDQVVFVIKISQNISDNHPDTLKSLQQTLKEKFVVSNDITMNKLEVTPEGMKNQLNIFGGVELRSEILNQEHKLVGKRANWQLRISGDTIQINCFNYTTWTKVSSYVNTLYSDIFQCLALSNEALITEVVLQYNDTFISEEEAESFNVANLFSKSKFMTENVIEQNSIWHLNSGWFSKIENENSVLNVLNISTHTISGEKVRYMAKIEHLQKFDVKTKIPISDKTGFISKMFISLHTENKALVSSLLTEEIKEQIGL